MSAQSLRRVGTACPRGQFASSTRGLTEPTLLTLANAWPTQVDSRLRGNDGEEEGQ